MIPNMKKISLYITSLALGALALASCSDNWERPPMDVPSYPEGFKPTMTIAELKTQYWQDQDAYGTTIGRKDGQDIYIAGAVVSSTAAGNIYKTLVLQDATGAITIGLDTTKIEELFPMGVGMAVNVTGLAIGRYNGLMQLGTLQGTGVNRISYSLFKPHTMLDFWSGGLDTTVVTIPEMNEQMKTLEGKIAWQSRLVRINGVKFVEAGEPFSNGGNTSRYIVDSEGNRMIVYNSSYADFAYDKLPYGTGDVVGILSCYRTSWQLLLIDAAGCIDFDGEGAPDPNLTTILNESFASKSQGDFTIENVFLADGLNHVWEATDTYGMKASAYVSGQNLESDSWLISPVLDLTGFASPQLRFSHCCNKFASLDDAKKQCTLSVRVDGGEWTPVAIPEYSGNDSWNFAESGTIDLAAFAGKKIQIGFRYTSSSTSTGTWEIKNVVLTAIKQ